jgi:hypothetical protein
MRFKKMQNQKKRQIWKNTSEKKKLAPTTTITKQAKINKHRGEHA